MKLLPLFFVLISFKVYAQNTEYEEYIVLRDSSKYMQGEVLYDTQNPDVLSFRKLKKDPFEQYKANEILEFKTKKGSIYISELVDGKYIFLRQLTLETNNLLLLVDEERSSQVFYLKSNGSLQKLGRESYNEHIEPILAKKRYGSSVARYTKYKVKSLSRAIMYSNSDDNFYPRTRYGIHVGLNKDNVQFETDIDKLSFDPVTGINLGAFVDIPFDIFSHYSARMEVQFTESSHSLFVNEGTSYNYIAKIQSLSFPVLLRYRFNSNSGTRFFTNIGPTFTKNKVSNNQVVSVTSTNIIEISELILPEHMFGGALGVGVEYSLSLKKDIGLEVRYWYRGSTGAGDVKMNTSSLQFISTFNF